MPLLPGSPSVILGQLVVIFLLFHYLLLLVYVCYISYYSETSLRQKLCLKGFKVPSIAKTELGAMLCVEHLLVQLMSRNTGLV